MPLQQQIIDLQQSLHERTTSQRELDREIVELRALVKELERQQAAIRRTLAFQLGQAILSANSAKGAAMLPFRIFSILWNRPSRRAKSSKALRAHRPSDRLRYVGHMIQLLNREGHVAATDYVARLPDRQPNAKARAQIELALKLRAQDSNLAVKLAQDAAALNPAEGRLRTLAFELYDDGHVQLAIQVLQAGSAELIKTTSQQARVAAIRSDSSELSTPMTLPARASGLPDIGDKLAIIAMRTLPSHADAATFRCQAVAESAVAQGRKAMILSEPAYRYPSKADGRPIRSVQDNGVELIRLPAASYQVGNVDEYVTAVSTMLEKQFRAEAVGSVHIIGEPHFAMAGATAARRAGLPYCLDIGSIPLAGGAGRAGWMDSERFAANRSRLVTVATGAESVIVRSRAIAAFMEAASPGLVMELIEDSVPSTFVRAGKATQRDTRRELNIGEYHPLIGVISESDQGGGLHDFLRAMPMILARVPDAILVFCVSSRVGHSIRHDAAMLGIAASVLVPDGFVRQRLAHYISTFSAMLFPAQRIEAGLTPPFELQVAQKLGTPIISVASEWASDSRGTTFIAASDPPAIAEAIIALIEQTSSAGAAAGDDGPRLGAPALLRQEQMIDG